MLRLRYRGYFRNRTDIAPVLMELSVQTLEYKTNSASNYMSENEECY